MDAKTAARIPWSGRGRGTALCAAVSVALLALAACRSDPPPFQGGPEGTQRRYFSVFRRLWLEDELAAHPHLAAAPRYHLDLEVADDVSQVEGSLALVYTNPLEIPLSELPFFCYPNLERGALEVRSVEVAGLMVQPEWRARGSLLVVPLPSPVPPGERVKIRLRFGLQVPAGQPGDRGLFALTDGFLSLGHAYPMVPAPAAWSERLPAMEGDTPYGDFVTNEVAFFTARLVLPAFLQPITPGVELARNTQGGRTEVLVALGPARELYLAAGRDLLVLEERRGRVTVRSIAPPGRERDARFLLEAAHAALEIFGRHFGPYPFTTFTVLAAPLRALGMEFPGIVLLAASLYERPEAPHDPTGNRASAPAESGPGHAPSPASEAEKRRFDLEGTLAHEVAHQWFYGLVGTDQLQEPWIDESLAQYAYYLYYRDRYGDGAAARRDIADAWDRLRRAEIPIDRPVSAYTRQEYGAIIYGRAPLFLEALAQHMGEERFELLVRELVRRYRWRLVDGQGFKSLAVELGGPGPDELERLWRRWVHEPPRAGSPK